MIALVQPVDAQQLDMLALIRQKYFVFRHCLGFAITQEIDARIAVRLPEPARDAFEPGAWTSHTAAQAG